MSTEASSEQKAAEVPKPSRDLGRLLVLIPLVLSTLATAVTFGFLIYSKFIFKRPAIREPEERLKLESTEKKLKEEEKKVVFFSLDPITVNIASSPVAGGDLEARRLHYVNLGVAFETHGDRNKDLLESLKPYILDQIIVILGKKSYEQLATIQGRYVLQFQIQEAVNQIVFTKLGAPPRDPPVSHTFFNQFIVQ